MNAPAQTIDKSGDRVKEMFGQIAGRYDLLNHLLSGGIDIYWRNYTVRQVPIQGTSPVLDVCTGTGDLALTYWASAKGTVVVTGTDFTPEMLVRAKQKFAKRANQFGSASKPVDFLEADTLQLPFNDNQFQIVSVGFGLRNVADTEGGLREMIRVCEPGGRVAILEFSKPPGSVFGALYRWYFNSVLPRVGQFVSKNRQEAYRYLPSSVSQFPCGQALADMMESCGLRNVQFTPLTFGIATLYVGEKPTGSQS
ncbi:MAG: bifunctional demethylmenaquinone methyltransferase/2-methoxy-6-polyprenyl-1,4-benzoquinol methylase UbiE [Planctomycetaceae bacterium]|nr:bifunctional demethylmenaquinone methyltransferase/2-methoxy-6-polyprenyl-1,4-benzoquinol methylase UbiE [Planctomycetaceae bacterium]